jgi:ethanolamine permease
MATLVVLTALVLFGAVGAAGWREVVYTAAGKTSDSPLPLAISHVVPRDSALFGVLTGVGLVGLVASLHGILIAASRAILELGRAGYAPRVLGEVHATRATPVPALLANLAIGLVTVVTGKTTDIIPIAVFGALTLYILSSAAVLQLRRSEPALARPYRAPLYPITPWLAIALSAVCVVAMAWTYPWLAAVYAVVVGGAWLAFVLFVPADRRVDFHA